MALNKIEEFDPNNVNILTDPEYLADPDRLSGHVSMTPARSALVNKTQKQTALVSSGLSEFVANNQSQDVDDSLSKVGYAGLLTNAMTNTPSQKSYFAFDVSGSKDFVELEPATPLISYEVGARIYFIRQFILSNEGFFDMTVAISGLGAKFIKLPTQEGKVEVPQGSVIPDVCYILVYDGTDFLLLNPSSKNNYQATYTLSSPQVISTAGTAISGVILYDSLVDNVVNFSGTSWDRGGVIGAFTPTLRGRYEIYVKQTFNNLVQNAGQIVNIELRTYSPFPASTNSINQKIEQIQFQTDNMAQNNTVCLNGSVIVELNGVNDAVGVEFFINSESDFSIDAAQGNPTSGPVLPEFEIFDSVFSIRYLGA